MKGPPPKRASDWRRRARAAPVEPGRIGRLLTGMGGPTVGTLWVLEQAGMWTLHGELEPGQNSCLPKIQEYAKALFSAPPSLSLGWFDSQDTDLWVRLLTACLLPHRLLGGVNRQGGQADGPCGLV